MIAPRPRRQHGRHRVLAGEENALQVQRDDAVPLRLFQLDRPAHPSVADIVM